MSAETPVVEPGWLPAAPDWFADALQCWSASGPQKNRGHAYLVVSEEAAEANLFIRLLAARQLCLEGNSSRTLWCVQRLSGLSARRAWRPDDP